MAEYIEREAAKAAIRERFTTIPERTEINIVLNAIPAADVAPVRRGRWRWRGFNIQCPFCEYEPFFESTEPLYNYCPNCGANMEDNDG